ncbi:hypothetical protein [Polyangium sp. 6x1]|uniref:hypothetical protein n=1 Tax=Polyangium sp. 6x1 TaxID=3042689 RepID=UPI002482ACDF|nr:hypothetical protein [Polyangium sp. 6x1]MDI1443533.1 hypothetical protein [Polyangium sp. 6x1]
MTSWHDELARRMAGPQRHRLLQGDPMLPLMRPAVEAPPSRWPRDSRRADGKISSGSLHEPPWVELEALRADGAGRRTRDLLHDEERIRFQDHMG